VNCNAAVVFVAVAFADNVMVVPLTAVTYVFAAIPVPDTKLPTATPAELPETVAVADPFVTDTIDATRDCSGICVNLKIFPPVPTFWETLIVEP
jgi:hypothetical protein